MYFLLYNSQDHAQNLVQDHVPNLGPNQDPAHDLVHQ